MVCLALELVGPWVVLGFSVGMEVFDELLSLNVPWPLLSLRYISSNNILVGLFYWRKLTRLLK